VKRHLFIYLFEDPVVDDNDDDASGYGGINKSYLIEFLFCSSGSQAEE
jgi:hypothetical protein